MKKVIGISTAFLLGGCSVLFPPPEPETFEPFYPRQNLAPWPWVRIVPSENALAYKDVEFYKLSNQLHYQMSFFPYQKIYKGINLILLDYGILPTDTLKKSITLNYRGKIYSEKKEREVPRYFLTASFYACGTRPPAPPLYEIMISLWVDKAPPQEAMSLMASDIIDELNVAGETRKLYPGWRMEVNLD